MHSAGARSCTSTASGGSSSSGSGGGAGTASAGGTAGTGGGGSGSLGSGGGGGGYYGGGGASPAAGGGGGSSYAGNGTHSSIGADTTGIPSISITCQFGAAGPSTGIVDAVVTMASSAVCLELSTTSIDFGTRQFGDVQAAATPDIGVTNCSDVGETILAHGTDANGPGPSAWSLADTGSCAAATLAADNYRLTLQRQDTLDGVSLSTSNKTLHALGGGASVDHKALIDTPCPGSSGAGVVMAMQIVFVATE